MNVPSQAEPTSKKVVQELSMIAPFLLLPGPLHPQKEITQKAIRYFSQELFFPGGRECDILHNPTQ